ATQSQRVEDFEIADTIDRYYERVANAVAAAGGTTVKFIGDAALVVFPRHAVDAGIRALFDLKASVDRFMAERGWECRLEAKVHFGEVIAGQFGPDGAARFDVIGRAVNDTAMLSKSAGINLSREAFRQLSPDLQQRFTQHSPPVTYVHRE